MLIPKFPQISVIGLKSVLEQVVNILSSQFARSLFFISFHFCVCHPAFFCYIFVSPLMNHVSVVNGS